MASACLRGTPPAISAPGRRQAKPVAGAPTFRTPWLGPEHGWVGLDPTNGVLVGEEHVILALGRDFSDISPLRGMILGGGQHTLRVGVDLEPMEADI